MSQQKKSKYAEKKARGNMMYGPGCCAHSLTPEQGRQIRIRNGTLRSGLPTKSYDNASSESGYNQGN